MLLSEDDEVLGLQDFIPALDGQRDQLVCLLGSFIAYLAMSLPKMCRPSAWRRPAPFRDCGGYSRWGQQLDGCRGTRAAQRRVEYPGQSGGGTRAALRRVGFSAQEVDGCSVRWRSGFPRMAGPPVLSSGCWVHDGSQMLSGLSDAPTLPARCRCQAATEHRINNANLVLHPIWNDELSSEKETQKGYMHRARFGRTPGL